MCIVVSPSLNVACFSKLQQLLVIYVFNFFLLTVRPVIAMSRIFDRRYMLIYCLPVVYFVHEK